MPVIKGGAFAEVAFATGSRYFHFGKRTVGGGSVEDLPDWEVEAGGLINLQYRTNVSSLLAPPAPTRIKFSAYYEGSEASSDLIRTLYDGTPPANGTVFPFYATHDGTENGEPRSGLISLYILATFSSVLGSHYAVRSNGNGTFQGGWARGVIRSNAKVYTIGHGGYPAGDKYALGADADENVVLAAAITPPFRSFGHEKLAWRIQHDETTIHTDPGHVVDMAGRSEIGLPTDSVFLPSLETYGAAVEVDGDSALQPTSGPIPWTVLSADSPALTSDGDAVVRDPLFDVDPRAYIEDVSSPFDVYNRGMQASAAFSVVNARQEALSTDLAISLRDSQDVVQLTVTLTGPNYQLTLALPDDADASSSLSGVPWTINIADPVISGGNSEHAFSVSSLLQVYVQGQLFDTLSPPSFPPAVPEPDQQVKIGTDVLYLWVHVAGADQSYPPIQTSGDAISITRTDPSGQAVDQLNTDSFADPSNEFTIGWSPRVAFNAVLPEGSWQLLADVNFDGNSGASLLSVDHLLIVRRELFLQLAAPFNATPGQVRTILLGCERNGTAVEADLLPQWRLVRADQVSPDFALVSDTEGQMSFCGTPSAPLYCADVTMPPEEGRYLIEVRASLSGQLLSEVQGFESRPVTTITHPLTFKIGPFSVPLNGESYVD